MPEILFSVFALPKPSVDAFEAHRGRMPTNFKRNSVMPPCLDHTSPNHSTVPYSEECDICETKTHQPAFSFMMVGGGSTRKLAEVAQALKEQKKRLGVREMCAVQIH